MNSAIDITEEQRKILIGLLHRYLPDVEVWAYGSRVKWTARPNSDLDLVVFAAPELESKVGELKDALAESDLPFLVDLHTWDDIPKRFHEIIRKEYVVVHESKAVLASDGLDVLSDWQTLSLAEVYDFSSGLSKPQSEFGSGHPFLSFKDVFYNSAVPKQLTEMVQSTEQEQARCSVMRGDVFLTRTSETMDELGMSSVALADFPGATFNGFTKRLRPKRELIVPGFARYFFRSPKFRAAVNSMSTMSTRASLNNEMLERLTITFPERAEQEAIAHILGTLDDKIELNRKMKETLESIARTLFQSWFVDFNPVRAQSEGRDPGLPAHISDLFPDRLQNSSLGPIPVGWSVVGLDEIANFRNGLALQKFPVTENGSLPAIKIAQLRAGNIDNADRVSIDIPIEYRVEDGDVLFSWSGSLECVVWTAGPGALNQHLFKVTSEQYPKWFFLGWIQHHLPEFREIAAGKATTMGHIQRHHLHDALVAVPPSALIQAINKQFESLLQASISAMLECKKLVSLRDSLLPKLISGELRVNKIVGNAYREEEVHREQYAKT
jgi:type I restriction enzyme S subunit